MTEPQPAAEERRHQRRLNALVLPLVLLASIALVGLTIAVVILAQRNAGYRTALSAQRQQAQQSGQTPVAKPPDAIDEDPAQPLVTPKPAPSGPRGPGPSDAQVRAAVGAYFQAHPVRDGRDVSPARLAASVANYLRRHPPGPDQLAAAVAAYLSANPPQSGPPGADGKDGQDGTDGQDATPEMVAEQVRQYMTDHPLPTCADGTHAEAHSVVTDDDHNPLTTDTVDAVICVKD